jgi:hypothetical protein
MTKITDKIILELINSKEISKNPEVDHKVALQKINLKFSQQVNLLIIIKN